MLCIPARNSDTSQETLFPLVGVAGTSAAAALDPD